MPPTLQKWIVVPISKSGAPALGLSPTIKIIDIATDTVVVSAGAMSEIPSSNGMYKYQFTAYDIEKNYAIVIDAGPTLVSAERYSYAGNESFVDDIQSLLTSKTPVIEFSN